MLNSKKLKTMDDFSGSALVRRLRDSKRWMKVWRDEAPVYDEQPDSAEIVGTRSVYHFVAGYEYWPADWTREFDTVEELRAEMGDLRHWVPDYEW